MTADRGIIDAGARKVRNGNGYNAATGARETALNKDGAPTPAMEVFRFPSTEALAEAAKDYVGRVTVIWNNGDIRRVETKESDEGPIDFFKELSDGSVVRCDRNGVVSTELEHLEPNNTGVVATGSTTGIGSGEGTGGTSPAAPGTVTSSIVFDRPGNQHIEAPAEFTVTLRGDVALKQGDLRDVVIAPHGNGAPTPFTVSVTSDGTTTEPKDLGTEAGVPLRANSDKAVAWDNDRQNVHPGDVTINVSRKLPDGRTSSMVIVDVQTT